MSLLDEIYAALPTVNCQRKCGRSICGPIVAFPEEIARMERAGFPLRFHHTVAADIDGIRCGYYDVARDRCAVHSARPLICRLYGAASDAKMICPWGCRPSFYVSNQQVQAWLDALSALDGEPVMQVAEQGGVEVLLSALARAAKVKGTPKPDTSAQEGER